MYELVLEDQEGTTRSLFYDPHTSELTHDGVPLIEDTGKTWSEANRVSPLDPGTKLRNPNNLKIQLGLKCNYACSYCVQASHINDASHTNIADAKVFIKNLDKWLEGKPKEIEFWGGEPMLYWKKIKYLLEELEKRWEEHPRYTIITNGSLLNQEIIDMIDKYDINVGVSHDGPGQHIRGPDPFDDPERMEWIKKLYDLRAPKGMMSFNSVITAENYDIDKIIDFFIERFGENCPVNFEGIVNSYEGEDGTAALVPFSKEQYQDFVNKLSKSMIYGTAYRSSHFQQKVNGFINSLKYRRPSSALGQKCGMDRADNIAVDLLGNVMTCQNVGAKGDHRLGHVYSFDKIKLTTSWHWSYREECSNCPVLQLCKGSCMFVEGKNWYLSCNNEYYYNTAILAGAMFIITGMILKEIKGKIVRPSEELLTTSDSDYRKMLVERINSTTLAN